MYHSSEVLQVNVGPPLCDDLGQYKDHQLYLAGHWSIQFNEEQDRLHGKNVHIIEVLTVILALKAKWSNFNLHWLATV